MMESQRSAYAFAQFGMHRYVPSWVEPFWEMPILNLGCGEKKIQGAVNLDLPDWDADLDGLRDFKENSVGGIIATHFLEHLEDPVAMVREAGRVLAPQAPFNILVPHAQSTMYLHDLDHKHPFVIDTFPNLLSTQYYSKNRHNLPFKIGANFLWGMTERNLCVVTQLIKLAS